MNRKMSFQNPNFRRNFMPLNADDNNFTEYGFQNAILPSYFLSSDNINSQ